MKTKINVFYSPVDIDIKNIVIKRMNKKDKDKRNLVIHLDEFSNYKGQKGLSNIIFYYKVNNLTYDKIKKEIDHCIGYDEIKSVQYAEDFVVMTNYELSNMIISIEKELECDILNRYDNIYVICDTSYSKNKDIIDSADEFIFIKKDESETAEIVEKYLIDMQVKMKCMEVK